MNDKHWFALIVTVIGVLAIVAIMAAMMFVAYDRSDAQGQHWKAPVQQGQGWKL